MDQSEPNRIKSELQELQTKQLRMLLGWFTLLMCIAAITGYAGYDNDYVMTAVIIVSAIIPLAKSCQYACEYGKLRDMLDNETLTRSQINEKKLKRTYVSIALTFHTMVLCALCVIGIPFVILTDIAAFTDIQFNFVVLAFVLSLFTLITEACKLVTKQYPEYKRNCAELGLKPRKFGKIVSKCLIAYSIAGIWFLIGFIGGF